MRKLFSGPTTGRFIAAIVGVCLLAGVAGAITSLRSKTSGDAEITGDLMLGGSDLVDSAGTTRFTIGATNAVTGGLTVSGKEAPQEFALRTSTSPRHSDSSIGITPSTANLLVINTTDNQVCMSTGTTRFTWVQVSTPTLACSH